MMLLPDWSCLCKATFLKEKRSCFEMAQVPWLNPTTQTNTCTQTSARTHIQKQSHTHTSSPLVWAPQLFLLGMCVIWIARARTKSTWLGKIGASRKISMKGNKYQIFHNMFSRTQENIHVHLEVMLLEMSEKSANEVPSSKAFNPELSSADSWWQVH